MRIVICGGGVIAACSAYFLAQRGIEVIVVERNEVGCAASGKAGGFLALDWCAGSPVDNLARRSFALHARLASELDSDWAYRRTSAYSGYIVADQDSRRHQRGRLDWLREDVVISSRLATQRTAATIHPRKFTMAMMRAAQESGAQLRIGRVTGLTRARSESVVTGVEVEDAHLEADAVVIAMGPWSILASQWLPLPIVLGQQSPSLVYETGLDVPPEALFLEYEATSRAPVSVEVFPRGDGSTHVTAFSSQELLPIDPAKIAPDSYAINRLQAICERLSSVFRSERIIARQACFRPTTEDYVPLIGKIPGVEGAYIATGHNVWGILNAPATAEAISELIVDGASHSTDLTPFDPGRLRAVDPARLRNHLAS